MGQAERLPPVTHLRSSQRKPVSRGCRCPLHMAEVQKSDVTYKITELAVSELALRNLDLSHS